MQTLKPGYLALIPVLALLLGAWMGRAQLTDLLISTSMQSFGMEDIASDIDYIGVSQSNFSRFEFSFATDAGIYRLEAENVTIAYNLNQLTQGRADSVTVNRLDIHHQSRINKATDRDTVDKALEPVKVIAALRHALREYLIINLFSVNHLSFKGESFGIVRDRPLRLHAINDKATLATQLSLLERSPNGEMDAIRHITISKFSQDSLKVELEFERIQEKIAAGLDLVIHDNRIEGTYFTDPRLLHEWLQPIESVNHIDRIAPVTGALSVDFSSGKKIMSTVTARSDSAGIEAYQVDELEIQLEASTSTSDPFRRTKILNGSFVTFSKLIHDVFSLGDTRLALAGSLFTYDDAWKYDVDLNAESLTVSYDTQYLQLADISATVAAGDRSLKLQGSFTPAKAPGRFSLNLEHNLIDEFGRFVIETKSPVDLDSDNIKLSHIWTPWPYPFDLLKGRIKLNSDATWSNVSDFSLNAKIQIENAGGHYGEIIFSGLSFDHRLRILPSLYSVKPGKITLDQLDSGVIASNINTTLSLETSTTGPLPQIVVRKLYGKIFDGSFSGNEIVFDLNSDSNHFELAAHDIDLAAVVATQQLEDIEVTGKIDGTIPVSINAQGIFIEHGAFINAVRAGTIRYKPATGTEQLKQNPITGIALDALRDFRYSHLSADVNFTPDGMLVVSLQLKGTSPELETRRPVHLNINTEQNLLSLLKSLRYAESLGSSIDQRVRSKYNRSTSENQDRP